MERKPYYISRISDSSFVLNEGTPYSYRKGGGTYIQLYLMNEEVKKYNPDAIKEILRPYAEIMSKRYMYIPSELIIYAICEVLYA